MTHEQTISSVLVIGTENAVSLPVIRSLASLIPDLPIHTLSRYFGERQSSRYSRYVTTHTYLRSETDQELLVELKEKIKETGASLLLPVDEYYVRKVSLLNEELKKIIHIPPLPDPVLFDSLVNKYNLNQILAQYGLPVTESYSLSRLDPDDIRDDFFPCLLKPVSGSTGHGMVKVEDRAALIRHMKAIDNEDYIIQELITGLDIGCSLFAIDGHIKALTTQKSLSKSGFSFSTALQFQYYPQIAHLAEKLIHNTGYSGLADMDFRLDERDGLPKLVDFNARFWLTLPGAAAAGIDFTELACLSAIGIPFKRPRFKDSTYIIGRSTITHYRKRLIHPISYPSAYTTTDAWSRLQDPLPEILRLLSK